MGGGEGLGERGAKVLLKGVLQLSDSAVKVVGTNGGHGALSCEW